eukprot:TRINITY_DN4574_c0_g1_i7.p1 TRINITY_DN4574_c0_g1~~TRINITY_DN4574_c0_g1_i7.p1  ORF type:complete len:349 (-),score=65.22 TRINITY_DN4574_c0_g1_i7:249-1274(-)
MKLLLFLVITLVTAEDWGWIHHYENEHLLEDHKFHLQEEKLDTQRTLSLLKEDSKACLNKTEELESKLNLLVNNDKMLEEKMESMANNYQRKNEILEKELASVKNENMNMTQILEEKMLKMEIDYEASSKRIESLESEKEASSKMIDSLESEKEASHQKIEILEKKVEALLAATNTEFLFDSRALREFEEVHPECRDYTILNDNRSLKTEYSSFDRDLDILFGLEPTPWKCDTAGHDNTSPDWAGAGWYRMMGPAGTRIPEAPPGIWQCGTKASGWMTGSHPAVAGQTIDVIFCFDLKGYKGYSDCEWSTQGKVTHCGNYIVYYLENTPHCDLRYCATNHF